LHRVLCVIVDVCSVIASYYTGSMLDLLLGARDILHQV
jgi:hypothetical protein